MTEYAISFQPIGILFLYRLFFWTNPIIASKILTFFLYFLFLYFIWKSYNIIFQSKHTVDFSLVLTLICPLFYSEVVGANARGFAVPIQAILIYGVVSRRQFWLLFSIIAGFLFHPQSMLIGIVLYIFVELMEWHYHKFFIKRWILIGCLFFMMICFSYFSQHRVEEKFGEPFTKVQIDSMPEFGGNGRMHGDRLRGLYKDFESLILSEEMGKNLYFFVFKIKLKHIYRHLLQVFIIFLSIVGIKESIIRRWDWTKSFMCYALSFLICYFLAYLFALKFYFPDRFLKPGVSVFFSVYSIVGLAKIVKSSLPEVTGKSWLFISIFTVLLFGTGLEYGEKLIKIKSENVRKTLEWFRTTPIETLIAGYPDDLDFVPTFSLRSVYINRETSFSFRSKHHNEINRRLLIIFKALYATDKSPLEKLREEGVDLIYIDETRYTTDYLINQERIYHDPIGEEMEEYIIPEKYNKFILLNPPPDSILFRAGNIKIISVDKLLMLS